MKVLGIEMAPSPGFIGSSSYGDTRIWRSNHGLKFKNDMMKDALTLWNEIEKELDQKLIYNVPLLAMGSAQK